MGLIKYMNSERVSRRILSFYFLQQYMSQMIHFSEILPLEIISFCSFLD
jgi:hypothetical protein